MSEALGGLPQHVLPHNSARDAAQGWAKTQIKVQYKGKRHREEKLSRLFSVLLCLVAIYPFHSRGAAIRVVQVEHDDLFVRWNSRTGRSAPRHRSAPLFGGRGSNSPYKT